jgi:hypothetical protein
MPQYVSSCREAEQSITLVGVRISINIQTNEGDTDMLGYPKPNKRKGLCGKVSMVSVRCHKLAKTTDIQN